MKIILQWPSNYLQTTHFKINIIAFGNNNCFAFVFFSFGNYVQVDNTRTFTSRRSINDSVTGSALFNTIFVYYCFNRYIVIIIS